MVSQNTELEGDMLSGLLWASYASPAHHYLQLLKN